MEMSGAQVPVNQSCFLFLCLCLLVALALLSFHQSCALAVVRILSFVLQCLLAPSVTGGFYLFWKELSLVLRERLHMEVLVIRGSSGLLSP